MTLGLLLTSEAVFYLGTGLVVGAIGGAVGMVWYMAYRHRQIDSVIMSQSRRYDITKADAQRQSHHG